MRPYLIFVRVGRQPWQLHGEAEERLSVAVALADALVSSGKADRVVVMEVAAPRSASTTPFPSLIYRHGAKKVA